MQIELERLISVIGHSVSNAQRVVAASAIDNYLSFFHSSLSALAEDAQYSPDTVKMIIPPLGGEGAPSQIDVPIVTMAHHHAIGLDSVRIKLRATANVNGDEKVILDISSPSTSDTASTSNLTEMELYFRCGDPPEGTARVNTEINKLL